MPNIGLQLTKEPVTTMAGAIAAPEPLRSSTRRWAEKSVALTYETLP